MFNGVAARLRREHNDRAWLAWHIASLSRSKKIPKLETLFSREKIKRRRQSPEELMAIAMQWTDALAR